MKGSHVNQFPIEAACQRVREAKNKFERQQERYALIATRVENAKKSEKGSAAKALLLELQAEFEASEDALRKLEREDPAA